MFRLFQAIVVAGLLLAAGVGSATAATLENVLSGVELIKVITPDKMQVGTLGDGREGFLHKDVDAGLVLSVAGPRADVDEVNALVSLGGRRKEAITKAMGICVLVVAVTAEKRFLKWAGEALENLGKGRRATFSGWSVSLTPVEDTNVVHVLITKSPLLN